MGAELAGADCRGGRCGLVLPRQAGLAASAGFRLSRLEIGHGKRGVLYPFFSRWLLLLALWFGRRGGAG